MRSLLRQRAVSAILACVGGMALSATLANADDTVVSRDDIVRQLGLAGDRAIGVRADTGSPPVPRVSLSAIRFEFNSDRLTVLARTQVDELAGALSQPALREMSFAVVGHTDSVGAGDYNRSLSLRRARSVKRHLVSRAVDAVRLVEVGLGEDYPVAETAGDDARNRRVEIVNLRTDMGGFRETSGPARPDGSSRRGRALLIGIERYRQVNSLLGTVNDARAMKGFVSARMGFEESDIKLLLDDEATRDNILRAIEEWLIAGTREGQDVFLYFSGHGSQQGDDNADESDGLDETLVPVDATVGEDRIVRGMIADDEIAALLARLSGRRVHVVIDACHSGTSDRGISVDGWRYTKTPRAPDGAPLRIGKAETAAPAPARRSEAGEGFVSSKDAGLSPLDITVWAAVRADQKALVDEESLSEPGSVFTRRILWGARDGKADADADGTVTRSELHDYVVRESEAYCGRYRHRCGRGLTPQLHTASGGPERPAFSPGTGSGARPSIATFSKDILVDQAEQLVVQDERGVRLDIEPGTALPVGTTVDIVVESYRDGHLVLLDIDSAGRMVQIFPNRLSEQRGVSDRIRAGQTLRVPGKGSGFRFSVEPPAGEGMLLAIVAERSRQLTGLVSRHKDLAVVERPRAYLVELHEALRTANEKDWGRATRKYEVVARQ